MTDARALPDLISTRDMNIATDLAALKHISLTEAIDLVNKAEHGRMRGLIDLGITTAAYTDSEGNLIKGSKDVGKAMDELEKKTKGGRETLTSLQKSGNTLANDWQDLANRGGPVLLAAIDGIVKKVDELYQWFDRIGKDDKLWGQISDRLVAMARWIHDYIIVPLQWVSSHAGSADTGQVGSVSPFKGGRASGGPVIPGGIYTVGERGPETLVMGARGGTVIPNGGGSGAISVYVNNPRADAWEIANEISWAKKTRRLG